MSRNPNRNPFQFPAHAVMQHPLYARAATTLRARSPRAGLVAMAMVLWIAILYGYVADPVLPWAGIMGTMAIGTWQELTEWRRLRDTGVLRDLVLAGQPPLLTMAALQEAGGKQLTEWLGCAMLFAFVAVGGVGRSILSPQVATIVALGLGVMGFLLALIAARLPLVGFVTLKRVDVLRHIGRNSHFVPLGLALTGLLPLGSVVAPPWIRLIVFFGTMLTAYRMAFLIHPSQRHLLEVPADEFEDWVREWCVGGPRG